MANSDPQGRFIPSPACLLNILILMFTKLALLPMNVNTLIEMAFEHVPGDTYSFIFQVISFERNIFDHLFSN